MRRVKFRKYVPIRYEVREGQLHNQRVKGTGQYEDEFNGVGLFHQWSQVGEEGEINPVAIVETDDGLVTLVLVSNIRFLDAVQHK